MAVDTLNQNVATKQKSDASVNDIAAAILAPIASLKLTVFLLFMAVFVTFIATLQQATMDMWTVKSMHYDHWIVPIQFQWLFIEKWFPGMQNVPGKFYIPSGKTLIFAMLINLTAAHVLRFRLQAKGGKLLLGILATIVAGVVTWAIVFNTQGADGFQKSPPIPYVQMWLGLQVIVFGLVIAALVGAFSLSSEQRIEKVMLGTFAFVCAAVLGATIYLGEKSFIGESGMRVLWQLAQATIAACCGFAACLLLFNRKAGIVLLHLGLAGLLLNELFVTYTNVETRITLQEGQTASHAIDVRKTELAIIDQSNEEFDEMVVIPESRLANLETVDDSELPFTVKTIAFFDNSSVTRRGQPEPEFSGLGGRLAAFEETKNTGDEVDFASAVIELSDKKGTAIGKYLVSQMLYAQDLVDTVTVDGKDYQIALRFKTEYKPYSLKLNDVSAKYYVGTETPKSYSSDVVLTDLENSATTEKHIFMNNPLRYEGETFYQSGYDNSERGESSVFQVVENKGWMIPYVCCMFVVVGLLGQFGTSLLAFLTKSRKRAFVAREREARLATDSGSGNPYRSEANHDEGKLSATLLAKEDRGAAWPAIAIAALFGIYALYGMYKTTKPVEHNEIRLDLLGQIPITYGGRVQPLDSLARNTARQLSKRELVLDEKFEKQPAIRWLADTMFRVDGFDKYRLFRIEELEVLTELGLPEKRPAGSPRDANFRYTRQQLAEVDASDKIRNKLGSTSAENHTLQQKRLKKLLGRIQTVGGLSAIFDSNADREIGFDERIFRQLEFSREGLPRAIPTQSEEEPWTSLAATDNQNWLIEQAGIHNVETTSELLPKLIEADSDFAALRTLLVRERCASDLMARKEGPEIALRLGATSLAEAEDQIVKLWDSLPAELATPLFDSAAALVDQRIVAQMVNINSGEEKISPASANKFADLFAKLGPAYRAGDAETFNTVAASYLEKVNANPPSGYSERKMATEKIFNGWAPFHLAMVMYLISFVIIAISWGVGRKPLGRAAFWLMIVALLIHVIGLVMRVVISGRPPVTNLYSSALGVSAVFVVLMIVAERLTKIGVGTAMGCIGAFLCLMWAWTMSIADGDTFTVLQAVLDTQFWLSTHVVCISIGYAATFAAGMLGFAYILIAMLTPAFTKQIRREVASVIYGITCFALFCSFFGTVLGGLWGDDSWGRFWGWDPKENGALMIVLWNAVVLHARWGGMIRGRGLAILAALGNIVVLWSWKGVNAMGVGLHAYGATEDPTLKWMIYIGLAHLVIVTVALIPTRFWWSHVNDA